MIHRIITILAIYTLISTHNLDAQLSIYPIIGIEADSLHGSLHPNSIGMFVEIDSKWIDSRGYFFGAGIEYQFFAGIGISYEYLQSAEKRIEAGTSPNLIIEIPYGDLVYKKRSSNFLLSWKFKDRLSIGTGYSKTKYYDMTRFYLDYERYGSFEFSWNYKEIGIPVIIGGRIGPVWISLEYTRSIKYQFTEYPLTDPVYNRESYSKLEPIHTAAIRVTCPLKFKSTAIKWDKLKKKSKVDCPKL